MKIKLVENKTIELLNSVEIENNFAYEGLQVAPALNVLAYYEEIQDGDEVEINNVYNNCFEINGKEYLIFNDYEAAEKSALESCIEIINDCGIDQNLIDISINHGFLKLDPFVDFWRECAEFTAYNEGIEYISTNEEWEQLENGEITDDEIRDNYYNRNLIEDQEQAFEEFLFQFGREYTEEFIKKENLINIEELAQYCVDVDGVAHFLSSYDGEELEYNNYYLYRTN